MDYDELLRVGQLARQAASVRPLIYGRIESESSVWS